MYNRIMLTVDGSPIAEQALPHALKLVECLGAELHLVRVVVPFGLLAPTTIEYDINESYRRSAISEAHEYLHQLEQKLQGKLDDRVQTKVVEGVIVDAILDYADFHNIDLIVMATHGRSGLGRWVFGSVAERVLHAADVPVFLVRARKDAEAIDFLSNAEAASMQ